VNLKRRSLAALAAISLLLAACGDDSDESSGAPATDAPAADATTPPTDATGGGRGDYGPSEDGTSAPATDAPATDAPATDAPATDAPAAGGAEIVISGFAFSEDITVPVGTTVIVRNDDGAGHTFTADDGAFDTGVIDGGGTAEVTLTEAGTFAFHCELHPSMSGTITVTA
jgi:plastocyanin